MIWCGKSIMTAMGNQWSIICSAMDWVDVVVEEIDTSKLCSKNDNASSIKMMTFINCIDVLWESIQQLHRVIFDPRSIPFQDDSSVFTDKLYESSDNEYFKTIRACFSAHPVNLNDRFNGEGKEQRYASWSGGGFGCKDFSVMLYSNTKEGIYNSGYFLFRVDNICGKTL